MKIKTLMKYSKKCLEIYKNFMMFKNISKNM